MSTLVNSVASLEALAPAFRQRLQSMYSGEQQPGNKGLVELDKTTRISEPQGMWIYDAYLKLKPKQSLEIGLADAWHGVGSLQAEHLGMEHSFRFLEEFSVSALARFAIQKDEFEFVYIDGNHRFDDVFVDFTLSAEVCPIGGNIILDDMWMPSIQTAVSWIRSNRIDFREIPTPIQNIAQFERTGRDGRNWDHFVPFFPASAPAKQPTLSKRLARRLRRMLSR